MEKKKSLLSKIPFLNKGNRTDGDKTQAVKKTPLQKTLTGIGVALCIVFSFLLICNMVIIIKGTVSPEKPPSVFGTTPMVVLSGSMSGDAEDHIESGDLVFINKADPDKLKVGDIIAFMDGSTTVTHRIIRVEKAADGSPQWITKGDANNTEDARPVTQDRLVGKYSFRLAGLGNLAMFLQRPIGMLVIIGIPCVAFIIYDIIRRQKAAAKQDEKTSEMEAELARLRELVSQQDAETVSEDTADAAEETVIEIPDAETDAEEISDNTTVETDTEVPDEEKTATDTSSEEVEITEDTAAAEESSESEDTEKTEVSAE